MNQYCRLSHFKKAAGGITATTDDAEWLRVLARASRQIDTMAGRHFYADVSTHHYDLTADRIRVGVVLIDDLVTATTVKVDTAGDATYATTLTVNTDYWFGPDNKATHEPAMWIRLNPQSSTLSSWPEQIRGLQIVGTHGYSFETTSAGTINEDLDASETGVDLTGGHSVEAGDTLIVDSEQMYVSAVAANVATVTRGINGTTAANHTNGTTMTVRLYPREIEKACVDLALSYAWDSQTGILGSDTLRPNGWRYYKDAERIVESYRLRPIA